MSIVQKTINQNEPRYDALLSQLQGNILKGHGRDHTANVFLEFHADQLAEARTWLRTFVEKKLTTAKHQLAENERYKRHQVPGGLFVGLYISGAGYAYFQVPTALQPDDPSRVFRNGMKQAVLNDPAVTQWDCIFQKDIHVMVLLAHDDKRILNQEAAELIAAVRALTQAPARPSAGSAPFLSDRIGIEYGNALRNANGDGLEHFGYVDGISQPLFFDDELAAAVQDPIPAGAPGATAAWDPAADSKLVLVEDHPNSAHQGSFFVFRKLEQNVRGFKQAEQYLATAMALHGDERELAGALLVGRFEDGTPVALSHSDGMSGSGRANNFNYDDDDGRKCPFHAHVRKSNPRRVTNGDNDKTRIMARRGIPYGLREVSTEFECQPEQFPEGGVGLLFQSFQADIREQSEFIQSAWVNNAAFPMAKPATGIDPLIGEPKNGSQRDYLWPTTTAGKPDMVAQALAGFVTLRGGEYFYAPSLHTLKAVIGANGAAPHAVAAPPPAPAVAVPTA